MRASLCICMNVCVFPTTATAAVEIAAAAAKGLGPGVIC